MLEVEKFRYAGSDQTGITHSPGVLLINTAGLSLSTVVAAPEAASQEAMRVAPVAKGLPVTASGAVLLYG